MGKLVILIALVLCPALSAGNIDHKLPDLTRTITTGCTIKQVFDTRIQKSAWMVTVWARYVGSDSKKKDWKLWYCTRKKRMKAMGDCDHWLKVVAKAIKNCAGCWTRQ